MLRLVAIIAIVAAVAANAQGGVPVSAICSGQSSADRCARIARTRSNNCVWLNGACVQDPCYFYTNETICKQNERDQNCLVSPWMSADGTGSCISYDLICNRIDLTNCLKNSMCAIKSDAYCAYGIPKGNGQTGEATAECTQFPLWSVALIVLWLFIMLILGAIIVLAMKRKQQAITSVEQGKAEVDQVAIREDNFQPLVNNRY